MWGKSKAIFCKLPGLHSTERGATNRAITGPAKLTASRGSIGLMAQFPLYLAYYFILMCTYRCMLSLVGLGFPILA